MQTKRRPVNHSDGSYDDPNSLRVIVARETRKLAKRAKAVCIADALEAHRTAEHRATAQEITDQGLTTADLQEYIDLQNDFAWQQPLSRAKAIKFVE